MDELVLEVDRLQKALRMSDSKLTVMATQLNENEAKMQQMQSERKKQLADVMQMKHDALAAALGEKNAHIALLEVSHSQITGLINRKGLSILRMLGCFRISKNYILL